MDSNPPIVLPVQTAPANPAGVLAPAEVSLGEVLPEVWRAAEALAAPDLETRWQGVQRLAEMDAARRYPLVAYLLATRLIEPDIALRTRVVELLGEALCASDPTRPLHPAAYANLLAYLGGMRTRPIYALLQVAEFAAAAEPLVAALLSYCSYAGEHMAEILSNRDGPIEVRWQAAHFIGRLGFLDALPTLERLSARMELRNVRSPNPERLDEANLLLEMRQAVEILRAP